MPSSTPCGILTDSVRSRVTRPEPAQDGQASSIIWPRPWQPGQVRSSVKKPCACRTRPAPPHIEQVFGLVPALAPVPEQDLAGDRDRDLDLRGLAEKRLFQRDFHVVAQVGAALAPAAAAALPGHAEQVFENIGERRGKAGAEAGTAAAHALLERGMAEAVIGGALVAVLQDFVGFVDFLEAASSLVASPGFLSGCHFIASLRNAALSLDSSAFRSTSRVS